MFPLSFAIVAIGIAIANFSNAAIVERFGARRVSQSAVFAFMATSILQIIAALSGAETLWMFTALMMVNVGLVGFIGSNFGSIAMEDFGHMAGVARSEEHTSELQSLMRSSYAVFCLKQNNTDRNATRTITYNERHLV